MFALSNILKVNESLLLPAASDRDNQTMALAVTLPNCSFSKLRRFKDSTDTPECLWTGLEHPEGDNSFRANRRDLEVVRTPDRRCQSLEVKSRIQST